MTMLQITPANQKPSAVERLSVREVLARPLPRVNQESDRWRHLTVSGEFTVEEVAELPLAARRMPRRVYAHYGPYPDPANPPLPDAHAWSAALAQAVVEVLMGLRPVGQLQRWVTRDFLALLERRCDLNERLAGKPQRTRHPQVLTTKVCMLADDLVETTHVVEHEGRVRAVALRMEGWRRQWLATAIEII